MLTRARRKRRAEGFTLVEVIVTVLLISVLASAVVPTMRGRIREGYEAGLISELDALSSGVQAYRQNVGHYPPSMDYLNVIPAGGTDECSPANALTAAQLNNFRGPYISRNIISQKYLFAGQDTIETAFGRDSGFMFVSGPIGVMLTILVDGVDSTTVDDIDRKLDGTSDRNYGIITWIPVNAKTQMKYRIPVRPNTC
jgi:prepilin-type N-terminal cleavage/methylation domain-containing protein